MTIRDLLDIPEFAPDFREEIPANPDVLFKDSECDECEHPNAVVVEYTVNDPHEGFVATDASFCIEHAGDGLRCILDRSDRSVDHDTTVHVNYWALRYGMWAAA